MRLAGKGFEEIHDAIYTQAIFFKMISSYDLLVYLVLLSGRKTVTKKSAVDYQTVSSNHRKIITRSHCL
jgi:hypothetical protein